MVYVKEDAMTQEPRSSEYPEAETAASDTDTDTEGHSLLYAELAKTVIRDRQRDEARNALNESRRREVSKPARSLRSRILHR
jgi:hypothetical protein